MTFLRGSDTDRDGLTDWYETVTDSGAKLYGGTDPLNRDSDNDGAIDGGESNIYPGQDLDIDGDGVIDSGKQIDLNGDGYIEMGEENYYETSPNNVTYFLDIFAVADQEYRDYYKLPWNSDNYKNWIYYDVDGAAVYFQKEFMVTLKVVEISDDVWNSDDADDVRVMGTLLHDVKKEYSWTNNKRNADSLIAFTGKDPDYEGMTDPNPSNLSIVVQIPELSDPRVIEFWEPLQYLGFYLDPSIQILWSPRLTQHEVSHIFGAYDYGLESPDYHEQDNITGIRLVSSQSSSVG